MNMVYDNKKITAITSWLAALTAALIGLGLPVVYCALTYFYQDAALQTEAEINARIVTRIVNANPELWRYEDLRLMDVLQRRPDKGTVETRSIRDLTNRVIVQSGERLPRPIHSRTAPLLDSGTIVGSVEISRSLRPLLETTALLALLGSFLGFAVFCTLRMYPIRTLRQTMLALFEEKERAQVTLHSIGDGVITTDAEGRIGLINGAAERLTGWPQREAEGRFLHEIFQVLNEQTRTTCENPVERVLRQGDPADFVNHTVLLSRDGTERIIANSGAPIRGQYGNVIGVVLVFRDVTEKQKLEAEMQKAAKLESLGVLAGGIAHDFNNLLTVILGNISLAMMHTSHDGLQERLASAEGACLRARNLTYQLLTFSKGGTPVKENISLPELIRSSADFALTGSNVRPEIFLADNLPPVKADAGQINQVLHNLILNAVEAMPGDGGTITLRAERFELKKNNAVPLPEGIYVRISVQDRGSGVPKDQLSKIFDPYFSTKRWGSGLGLATSFSIIKNHGGHITVDSEPGKGTTFHFYLPASDLPLMKDQKQEPEDRPIPGRGMVLIMDDEQLVRSVAGEILKKLGYDVLVTAHGDEAIDQYLKARGSGKRFAAIILDLTIPGGMGGKETIRKIRELDDQVKAIVSSGYSEDPVMSDYAKYGFNGVLSKPYNVREMSRVLNEVLHRQKRD